MRCLLRWDFSDFTDSPEGHFFWYAPRDGDAGIHPGEPEAPREGLPASLAWGSNNAKVWQHTKLARR
jgi:hypothetical protein